MNDLYKLTNTIKQYPWGSVEWIPRLTGQKNLSGKPWAELWMGVHPHGMSTITMEDKVVPLSTITELPFLLKFLAAEKPLSIQAHPNSKEARKGFAKENKAGIAIDAPERNYRDPNHKPEILCALTPFTAMAGFRERAETEQLLSLLPDTTTLQNALKSGYRSFLSALFNLNAKEKNALCNTVLRMAEKKAETEPLRLSGELAKLYPGDHGILSPLYLNVLKLNPFESIFIPSGILHAYIHGFAMECMANSDNVLRGGLTAKHIDIQELFSILNCKPYKPAVLKPSPVSSFYTYKVPCKEFSFCLLKNTIDGSVAELKEKGDAIITVIEGTAELFFQKSGKKSAVTIRIERGESVFAIRRKPGEHLAFSGKCTLFAAVAPKSGNI